MYTYCSSMALRRLFNPHRGSGQAGHTGMQAALLLGRGCPADAHHQASRSAPIAAGASSVLSCCLLEGWAVCKGAEHTF